MIVGYEGFITDALIIFLIGIGVYLFLTECIKLIGE